MPGTTNLLQFDPPANNSETDAQYQADALRLNGAASGGLLPSPLFNKLMYQVSTFVAGMGQMLGAKGYTTSDANLATLVSVLMHIKTDADFAASMIQVPYASSVTFDAAQSSGFRLLLTGNVSSSTLINTSTGQLLTFVIMQDATGGRTFPWPGTLLGTYAPCPIANSFTIQQFIVLDTGVIVPVGKTLWLTPIGIFTQPIGTVIQVSASGNIANGYGDLTEEVNAASTNITRYLPTAVGWNGLTIDVKRIDSSTHTLVVQPVVAGQTIDGFPNYSINPYWSISFRSDGSNWIIR